MAKNILSSKVNLHTHTTYCDGQNSPEEMVLSAIEKGFKVLGFSGHSYTPFDESYCMSLEATLAYGQEVQRLATKYKDQLLILKGIEQDYYSNQPVASYDYAIGSVHAFYNKAHDRYIYVDYKEADLVSNIDSLYGGDSLALAEDYFERVGSVYEKTACNIIGHFDLVTKYNEKLHLFCETSPRYVLAVEKALARLLPTGAIFEINTGAMAKGYRTSPYPSLEILKKIRQGGGRVIISSDCHKANALDYAFEDALALARLAGFESIVTVSELGLFTALPI